MLRLCLQHMAQAMILARGIDQWLQPSSAFEADLTGLRKQLTNNDGDSLVASWIDDVNWMLRSPNLTKTGFRILSAT